MGVTECRYASEEALIPHYEANPSYTSPLRNDQFADGLLHLFDIPREGPVLDVGCGDGRLGKAWSDLTVDGVDYSPTRIALASHNTNGTYTCSDLYSYLEETTSRYRLAVLVEVLEHLEDPQEALRLTREVLVLGGHAIGTVPKNMPYLAHLQVFVDQADVIDRLGPTKLVDLGAVWGLSWTR